MSRAVEATHSYTGLALEAVREAVRALVRFFHGLRSGGDGNAVGCACPADACDLVTGSPLRQEPHSSFEGRVLILDDETEEAAGIAAALEHDGHAVRILTDTARAAADADAFSPDLIILELDLGAGCGFDLLTKLRARGCSPPIMVVSRRTAELDKVRAFQLGADDYMTKPVAALEMLERARLRMALWRPSQLYAKADEGPLPVRPAYADHDVRRDARGVILGPPGVGKTHLAIGLAISAAQLGRRVYYGTLADLVTSLEEAHAAGKLLHRMKTLTHPALLVVDEIGYLRVSRTGAMHFFQLMSRRYEHASTVLTSNKSFEEWGEIFGDEVMAGALIDRPASLSHHQHPRQQLPDAASLGALDTASGRSTPRRSGEAENLENKGASDVAGSSPVRGTF